MQYDMLASEGSVEKTVQALQAKRYTVTVVSDKGEALEQIKKIIPKGASVMNGASVTLEQIGYPEYLAGATHGWVDLHAKVNAENDPAKRNQLRKEATVSDYYLGSVHALTEQGEFVVASNTGSQLPHIVFNSSNLIFVVSTKKIVPNLPSAMERLEEYVVPLENKHMMDKYKVGTQLNKELIVRGESTYSTRKTYFILVKESLGF